MSNYVVHFPKFKEADPRCRVATPESDALPDSSILSGLYTGGHGPKPLEMIARHGETGGVGRTGLTFIYTTVYEQN